MPQPMPMYRMDVILLNKYKDNVITALHKAGVTEIDFLDDLILKENSVARDRPLERATAVSKNIIRTNRLIGSLKQFDVSKVSFLEGMLGVEKIAKVNVSGMNNEKILKDSSAVLSEIEPVVFEVVDKLEILNSEESEITKNLAECKLAPIDVNAEDIGEGKFLYTTAGISGDAEKLANELNKNFKPFLFESYPVSKEGEEQQFGILIAVMKNKSRELDDLLNKYGVRILKVAGRGKVGEILKKLNMRLKEIKKEKKESALKLNEIYDKYYQKLLVARELLGIEKERCEAFVSGAATGKTGMLRFWVPESESANVKELVNKESKNFCEISVNKDLKDAPVIMNNPKIIRPFEFITTMYGYPKYGNLDPTIFVIPMLILFIGMMVADAITGIVLILLGFALYKKYGRYSQGIKNLMTLIMLCGLMTVFVGVITGDYFGNLFYHYIFHLEHGQALPGQFLFPEDATHPFGVYFFLQLAIMIGLFHLILGTVLGGYNELMHGKTKEAVTHYFSWSILGFGWVVIFLSTNTLFPIGEAFHFPPVMDNLLGPGTAAMLGGALMIAGLLLAFMKVKAMVLLEFIDFFAFTLSYARITALLIAAGAVATSFNVLAEMAWSVPAIGPILGIIVFVLAQAIGMFIAILDGFVQSLRLVYVEHFSRYYTGGGREFKPFRADRRYTVE